MIESDPSFGYRTVAGLLDMNKNTVQRIFQIKGWQVVKRAVGSRPRVEAKTSAAQRPDERWATDLCCVWGGKDRWLVLALVIDCYPRQLLGWHLARTGKATTAGAALEQALIARYGTLGRVRTPFLLRSDNGLVFTSRHYTRLVRGYGLEQEFITPDCPQQNGLVERVIPHRRDMPGTSVAARRGACMLTAHGFRCACGRRPRWISESAACASMRNAAAR